MSEGLPALLHLFEHDASSLVQFLSLLFLPFAHEDLAIILGAYIVVNKIMPVALVVLGIYAGMVASDFVLYGIGAAARHLPWLTRLAVDDRVRGFAETLKRNLFGLVALCRVVPGVVFVAFVACGWSRVPLARFTLASIVVSALYLPLMLCIVVFFGDALDNHVGLWAWPFLLCVFAAIGFLRRQVFTFQIGSDHPRRRRSIPALALWDGTAASAQHLPAPLFYLPLIVSWLVFAFRHRSLTLPTVANPRIPVGGSKSGYLRAVAGEEQTWIADFVVVPRSTGLRTLYVDLEYARQALRAANLSFPVVAKPDISEGGAHYIHDALALRDYLRQFPRGEKLILQRVASHAGEATALYARLPGARSGRILSLGLRCDSHDAGDARPPLYRDARHCITPEFEALIDRIACGMREFHYGRFDLRFASIDELMRGEKLTVTEIHGIESWDTDARDPSLTLIELYRRLIEQHRIMFLIGDKNRSRGFEPISCTDVLKSLLRQNQLSRRRPASA